MFLITRISIFIPAILMSCSSLAASFDCKKASTEMERLICTDPQLSAADESLNAAFKFVLSSAQDKSLIVKWQREWLKSSEVTSCKTAPRLAAVFSARTDLLNRAASDGNTVAWNGRYVRYLDGEEDHDASTILLVGLKDNQIFVSGISLWYGQNAKKGQINNGEMKGIASVQGNRASFDSDGCKAQIIFKQASLVVESESGCGGLNVTFVGDYKKI